MKWLNAIVMITVLSSTVSGQIVLGPQVSGTHTQQTFISFNILYPSNYYTVRTESFIDPEVLNDGLSWSGYDCGMMGYRWFNLYRGVLEFNIHNTIAGAPFPVEGMTTYNWTATLEDLEVIAADEEPGPGVDLFNLQDAFEDGSLTVNDRYEGQMITRLCDSVPPVGSTYSADVTEALRHDLFGSTYSQTNGYILKPSDSSWGIRSKIEWSDNARIVINLHNGTPTPEATSTPVPEVTVTPTPRQECGDLGVHLWMPSHTYRAGDSCSCNVAVCNPGPETYSDVPLFVILNLFDSYYFWPDFSGFDYLLIEMLPANQLIYQVFPEFTWPEGAGTVTGGVQWLAAITNPDMTSVLGEIDMWKFGWE